MNQKNNRVPPHPSALPDGMGLHEIAAELGLTYNQVRTLLASAMRKVKRNAAKMNKEDHIEQ
jgi:DNA-directed RNA polymerase sigma subunit (sigma70/sigma32)